MRKEKLPISIAKTHHLLGAFVEFTNTWRVGWPKYTGLVTDVVGDRSLIISYYDNCYQVIIVPIEVVTVVRTVLQGSVWL
jgi:hypothetical protein